MEVDAKIDISTRMRPVEKLKYLSYKEEQIMNELFNLMKPEPNNVYERDLFQLQQTLHASGVAGVTDLVIDPSKQPPAIQALLKFYQIMARHKDDERAGCEEVLKTLTMWEWSMVQAVIQQGN